MADPGGGPRAQALDAALRSCLGSLRRSARTTADAWRRAAGGRCVVCRTWCAQGLCDGCERRFAVDHVRCAGCAMPLGDTARPGAWRCVHCLRAPPPWTRAQAGVDYGHPWDRLIADLKFHQRLDSLDVLLRPLLARLRNGDTDDRTPSALRLVPIPLSRERLRERGYNQSWELTRRIGRALSLEARADTLFRVRDTGRQLALHRQARSANLQGAFVVTPRHAAWVRGASIALVDDVLTTGATAEAATRTLLAAGAREVQLWVVARTPEKE